MDALQVDPRKFYSIFKGRTDRVAIYNAPNCKIISLEVKKGDWEIAERIKAHLGGQARLGIHNQLADNSCTWAYVIFDESSQTPTARESALFVRECAKLGLTEVKRERTKTKGENYACWLFFEKPIQAKKIRHFLNLLLKKLNIQKAEIIPSEDMLSAGSYGSYAWLPYFGGSDKWLDAEGNSRMDMGVKMGHTIFIDGEGAPLREPLKKIRQYSENEIDNAILYLSEYIPGEPSDEGLRISDAHIKRLAEKCQGFRAIFDEIKEKKTISEANLKLAAGLFKAFDREDYLYKLLSKTDNYDKAYYEKKIDEVSGTPFLPCGDFKAAGLCAADKICFDKRPPLVERYGKYEEAKNAPEDAWRAPSPALWIFQGIRERMAEEEDAETVIIDLDIISQEEYLSLFEKELLESRSRLIKQKRSYDGYDTGFQSLNQLLGGLKPDTVTVIAGPQGSYKTALSTQIATNAAALDQIRCCYITFSESQRLLTAKMLARASGIDYRKIARSTLTDEEIQRLRAASQKAAELYGSKLFVVEGNDGTGIRKIKTILDSLTPNLLVVDTLQQLPFVSKTQIVDIPSRLEQNLRQLKTLARYSRIPVIALYTTRERDVNAGELQYAESLVLSASDSYMHLEERPASTTAASPAQKVYGLIIRKNKSGDKNILIKLGLDTALQKFTEIK